MVLPNYSMSKRKTKKDKALAYIEQGLTNPVIRKRMDISERYLKAIRQEYNEGSPTAKRPSKGRPNLPNQNAGEDRETTLEEDRALADSEYWKGQYLASNRKLQQILKEDTVITKMVEHITDVAPTSYNPAPKVKTFKKTHKSSPQSA